METYNFSWKQLGDIQEGRPNLGNKTDVSVYRLMQFTMRARKQQHVCARDIFDQH